MTAPAVSRSPLRLWATAIAFATICGVGLAVEAWLRSVQVRRLHQNGWWTVSLRASHPRPSEVFQIVPDSDGRLWLGTDSGLHVFDGRSWDSYLATESGWPHVYGLAADSEDRVWVSSDLGLGVVQQGELQVLDRYDTPLVLATDPGGRAWSGSDPGRGIAPLTREGIGESLPGSNETGSMRGTFLLEFGPDGKVWADDVGDVVMFDGEAWVEYGLERGSLMTALVLDRQGIPWIGVDSVHEAECCSIYHLTGEGWKPVATPFEGPQDARIAAMAFDDQGRLWIALETSREALQSAVAVYDGRDWVRYDTDDAILTPVGGSGSCHDLYLTPAGDLWFAVDATLVRIEVSTQLPAPDPVADGVLAARDAFHGIAWVSGIAAAPVALVALWLTFVRSSPGRHWDERLRGRAARSARERQPAPISPTPASPEPERAADMPRRGQRRLWLGTGAASVAALIGLLLSHWAERRQTQLLSHAGWSVTPLHRAAPNIDDIRDLAVDGRGWVWLATDNGLYRLENGSLTRPSVGYLNTSLETREVEIDGRGRVWVLTGIGLYVVNGPEADWMGSYPFPIALDPAGRVWGPCLSESLIEPVPGMHCALGENGDIPPVEGPEGYILGFDPGGAMWLSVFEEGQSRLAAQDGGQWTRHVPLSDAWDLRLAFDPQGQPWVGGWSPDSPCCLLASFNGQSWAEVEVPFPTRQEGRVTSLAFDRHGVLWVSFEFQSNYGLTGSLPYGVGRYDGVSWHFYETSDVGEPLRGRKGDVDALYLDGAGRLWFGAGPALVAIDVGDSLASPNPVTDVVFMVRIAGFALSAGAGVAAVVLASVAAWRALSTQVRVAIRPWLVPIGSCLLMLPAVVLSLSGSEDLRAAAPPLGLIFPMSVSITAAWAILSGLPSGRARGTALAVVSAAGLFAWALLFALLLYGPSAAGMGYAEAGQVESLEWFLTLFGAVGLIAGGVSGALLYFGGSSLRRGGSLNHMALACMALVFGVAIWFVVFLGTFVAVLMIETG